MKAGAMRYGSSFWRLLSVSAFALAASLAWQGARAIDWSGVPVSDVILFYTGQASWSGR